MGLVPTPAACCAIPGGGRVGGGLLEPAVTVRGLHVTACGVAGGRGRQERRSKLEAQEGRASGARLAAHEAGCWHQAVEGKLV